MRYLQPNPSLPMQEGEDLIILWRDAAQGRREGLVLDVRACATPSCPCRDALVTGFTVAETLEKAAIDMSRFEPPKLRMPPGSPAPRMSIAAKVDIDTGAVSEWREAASRCDQSAMEWLRQALDPALLEAIRRRFAASKPPPASDDDWRQLDWSSWKPGTGVAWGEANPKTPVDSVELDGREYLVDDVYCVTPDCSCRRIAVAFHDPAEPGLYRVDAAKLAVDLERVDDPEVWTESQPGVAKRLWEALRAKYDVPKLLAERNSRMRAIGEELHRDFLKRTTPVRKEVRAKPNESCPCGSGKKFKRCCM